jgi:hypothetical protein
MSAVLPPDGVRRTRLHLDPTISWGHILTTLMLIGTLIAGWSSVDNRVTVVETTTKHNREIIKIHVESDAIQDSSLAQTVKDIDRKMDKLLFQLLTDHDNSFTRDSD